MVVLIVIAVAGAFLYAFLRPPVSEHSAARADTGARADAAVNPEKDGAQESQPLSNIQL